VASGDTEDASSSLVVEVDQGETCLAFVVGEDTGVGVAADALAADGREGSGQDDEGEGHGVGLLWPHSSQRGLPRASRR
jgi:hypothetical protein